MRRTILCLVICLFLAPSAHAWGFKAARSARPVTFNAVSMQVSGAAGTAFLTNASIDLSPYRSRPIRIDDGGTGCAADHVTTWTSGTKYSCRATAYIGAVGTGETCGPELLTDPGIESWADTSTPHPPWHVQKFTGTGTVSQESATVHGGSYSARLTVDAAGDYIDINQQFAGHAAFTLLRFSYWGYSSDMSKDTGADFAGVSFFGDYPGPAWHQYTHYACDRTGGYNSVYIKRQTSGYTLYYDDMSMRTVTSPSDNSGAGKYGAWLTDVRGGATNSFAVLPAAFNPNAQTFIVTISP